LKALKFLQLIGATKGDSVKEIEQKTEKMSREGIFKLIASVKKNNPDLWKKVGLL